MIKHEEFKKVNFISLLTDMQDQIITFKKLNRSIAQKQKSGKEYGQFEKLEMQIEKYYNSIGIKAKSRNSFKIIT